jgi:hypothetical protein
MPYFIFHIHAGQLTCVDQFDQYRAAKQAAQQQRQQCPEPANYQVKIMFAKSETEAELLLKDKREPQPLGDD